MRKYIGSGTFEITRRQKEYLSQAVNLGRLSYGPLSQQFEQEFAETHGCKFGVLSNSGTSSLLVALQTLKEVHNWQDGDEVIVPALTFVATVNIVLQANLKPVLVDVEPDYYGIDVSKIEQTITDKTRCIIPVHTFGMPCEMTLIEHMPRHYDAFQGKDVKIIEDSCECVGASHYNQPVGSWGEIACFSFYMAHHITCGVGGMSVTNNPEYAKVMRSLVNHGLRYDELPEGGAFSAGRDFEFDRIGHSFRVTELEAALGLAQLETLEDMLAKRLFNARYLLSGLIYDTQTRLDFREHLQLPKTRPNTQHSFMMFPIVCKQENIRDKLTQHLNEKGIGTRRMLPLVNQPCYMGLWNPADYPVAQWIDRNGFYIGVHQHLSRDDLDYMVEAIRGFFDVI